MLSDNVLIVKNARIRGKDLTLNHIIVEDGIITKIINSVAYQPTLESPNTMIIDTKGGWVTMPFVEPHLHLDTSLTAGEPRFNNSGTLFEGISIWSERKQTLTESDIRQRTTDVLKMISSYGTQTIRTHVDITDPELLALKTMLTIKEEVKKYIDLQIVAFPQEGILSFPSGFTLLEKSMQMGADVVGIIPHYEFQRDWGVKSIQMAMDLAVKYDKMVDAHCDEIDDEQSRFLEVLASEAYHRNIGSKVVASHTTAMGSYNNAYTYKLMNVLNKSQIHFVVNPLVNIHLGGRFDSYPKRRGFSRVSELVDAGLNVAFGHDDISDPWYIMGTGNPIDVVHMGLHLGHLMGYNQINSALNFIIENAAEAIGLKNYYIQEGACANFLIFDSYSDYNIIRYRESPRYNIRNGKIITKRHTEVNVEWSL